MDGQTVVDRVAGKVLQSVVSVCSSVYFHSFWKKMNFMFVVCMWVMLVGIERDGHKWTLGSRVWVGVSKDGNAVPVTFFSNFYSFIETHVHAT